MSKKHTQAVINDILLLLSKKADDTIIITEDISDHVKLNYDLEKGPYYLTDFLERMTESGVIKPTSNYPVRMSVKHVTVIKGHFSTWEITKKGRNLLAYNRRFGV